MTKLNIKVYRNLMGANDLWAARTRALLKKHQVVMLNLIGSPGAVLGIFLLAVGVTRAAMIFESPISGSNKVDWFIIDFLDHGNGALPVDYMGGQCTYPNHPGIDFMLYDNLTRDVGIDVLAAAEGSVVTAIDGLDDRGTNAPGNVVWLQHADSSYSYYAHLKRNSMLVSSGQVVAVGQKLAEVGAFKTDDVAHLHFGVYSSDWIAREMMTNELGLSQHFDWFDSYSNQVIRQVVSMGITRTNDPLVASRQWSIEWLQQTPHNYSVMASGSFCVWLKYLGFGTTDVLRVRLLPVSGPAEIIDFSTYAWSVDTYIRVSSARWYSDWIGSTLSNGVAYRLQYRWNNENWRDAPGTNNLVVVDDDRCEVFLSRYCSGTFEEPCMPTALTTSTGTYTNKVRLIWEPSAAAINYRVLRGVATNVATAMQIAVTGNTAYDDTNAMACTTYYYWVQAVNAVGASTFSASDSGFIGVVGPLITANGLVGDVYLNSGDPVAIAAQMMNVEPYLGTEVDWWVVARAGSSWYYLNRNGVWTLDDNMLHWHPVHQGGLFDLPATPVLNITGLGTGLYTFYFAVDYPMDEILNLNGPILVDSVNVIVQQQQSFQ